MPACAAAVATGYCCLATRRGPTGGSEETRSRLGVSVWAVPRTPGGGGRSLPPRSTDWRTAKSGSSADIDPAAWEARAVALIIETVGCVFWNSFFLTPPHSLRSVASDNPGWAWPKKKTLTLASPAKLLRGASSCPGRHGTPHFGFRDLRLRPRLHPVLSGQWLSLGGAQTQEGLWGRVKATFRPGYPSLF